MDGNEQLAVVIPMLKEVVHGIRDDQLGGPTPCAAFTVGGVLDHMAGLASAFAPMFRGEAPAEAASGAGPGTPAVERALDDLLDAVHSPGALDRTIQTPTGEMPGAVFARLVAFDGLVHGWDLATATQQPWEPPESLVREIDGFARQAITPAMRGEAFAAEQPAPLGASTMLRLVAFTGRTPGWLAGPWPPVVSESGRTTR